MLARIKRRGNVAAVAGFVAIAIGLYLVRSFDRENAATRIAAIVLTVTGDLLFLLSCWLYAKSKGYHGAWGLLVPVGFAFIAVCWFYVGEHQRMFKWAGAGLSISGLLILAFLPDRHVWGV